MSLRALTLHTHTHTHIQIAQMTKHSQTLKRLNGTIKVIKSAQNTRAWNCSSFQCYQSHTEFRSGRKQSKTWPTDWAMLQHLLPCQNLHVCSPRGSPEVETRESCEICKQNAQKNIETDAFVPVSISCFHKSGTSEGVLWKKERASHESLLNEYTVSCCWLGSV